MAETARRRRSDDDLVRTIAPITLLRIASQQCKISLGGATIRFLNHCSSGTPAREAGARL
jgi:hypothetical protein